jgi:hypothetical protein
LLFPAPDCAGNRLATLGYGKPERLKLNLLSCDRLYLSLAKLLPSHRSVRSKDIDNHQIREETAMSKGEQRSNRETKKPKKEKIKTIAAAPSQKSVGSLQSGFGPTKKK